MSSHDQPAATTDPECKCRDLIAHEYESLRVNVDAKWLTSSDWANAASYGRSLCPVHGKEQK